MVILYMVIQFYLHLYIIILQKSGDGTPEDSVVPPPSKKARIVRNINMFANNELTAFTADNTNTNNNANITTNTKKKAKKSTTTTKKPNPASAIRKFVPSRLDVSFYCFHLIIFIKLIFNIFIIFFISAGIGQHIVTINCWRLINNFIASTAKQKNCRRCIYSIGYKHIYCIMFY